jgi:hypothetical protein
VLGELAGKTYPQVERLAWRAALAVAPDAAERRRSTAERERARVTVFREESGAVGLSGRDLPAAEALSGHANVVARASEYEASGAFGDESAGRLQALAYTDLLNGISAKDRIAFARTAAAEPPAGGRPDDGDGDGQSGASDEEGGPGPSSGPEPDDGRAPEARPDQSGADSSGGEGLRPSGSEEDPGEPDELEMPPGHDHGFLWRLDSYWRFQERDGGVYVECEAISLSRSVPPGLGWFVNPIIRNLLRQSLTQTLGCLRAAIVSTNGRP